VQMSEGGEEGEHVKAANDATCTLPAGFLPRSLPDRSKVLRFRVRNPLFKNHFHTTCPTHSQGRSLSFKPHVPHKRRSRASVTHVKLVGNVTSAMELIALSERSSVLRSMVVTSLTFTCPTQSQGAGGGARWGKWG
jgi:hypothetical protein